MQLTKNFRLSEFLVTSTGIDNTPTDKVIENLRKLCVNVLQPLRELYGKPIIITSGYRSPMVNKAVGGSQTSQHILGEACDITGGNRALNKIIYEYIRDNLTYDQLINEYNYRWVHVSYTTSKKNRMQELKIG